MFETIDAAELSVPAELLSEGQRIWQSVNFRLHVQWFYMLYQTKFEGDSISSHLTLLTNEEQIAEMASFDHIKIIDIYIVSPGHLNGSDCWKMEKIKEIWTAKIKKYNQDDIGMIYVLQNNSEYTYSPSVRNDEELIKNNLLMKI